MSETGDQMKIKKILSLVLMAVSAALAAGTIGVVSHAMTAEPVVLAYSEDAAVCVETLMDSLCAGDYEAASEEIYGTPVLGSQPDQAKAAVTLIWEAFVDTMEYEVLGELYPQDSGLAVDVKVRSLDVSSVTQGLDQLAQAELNKRVEAAEDSTEIYDEKNDYRQELVEEVLCAAVEQQLQLSKKFQEQTISLKLVFDQGRWWVLPEGELLNVLAGSIPG